MQGHPDGFGFLVPDEGGDDYFLNAREMHKVLHGDRAVVRTSGVDRRGRPEGEIVEVLARANREVVGRLYEERGIQFIVAENRRINQDFLVPPRRRHARRSGEVVVAEIVEQPSDQSRGGRAREGGARQRDRSRHRDRDRAAQARAAVRVLEGGASARRSACPTDVRPADRKGRVDLTALPLVTIDGETAKDFDDAVYCERKGRNFRLIVAIADVSHYVRDGDAIDRDARERGTSVYFPRRVIPMLPEELSNELCSLKADVDRLCMACDMEITPQGAIKSYKFYPAVMHSRARLTYTQVWAWLSEPTSAKGAQPKALLPHLANLYALYQALAGARGKRGAIDFDTPELAIEFDDHGKITAIVPAPRNDAHKLIEECMLAANVCAADFLAEHQHAALYRVHDRPPPDKLAALRDFLATSALQLGGGDEPAPADYAKLLEASATAPTSTCCRRCCCARCRRRSTGPTTKGTSDSRTTRTRTSRRRSAATRTCSCTARSRPRSPASSTSRRHDVAAARRAHVDDRAARRRRVARRDQLAQVPLHAGPGRRGVRRHDQRRHELRPLRHAGRPVHRRARAHHRTRPRLFPLRADAARADRRAHGRRVPAGRPRARERSRASTWNRRRSTSRWTRMRRRPSVAGGATGTAARPVFAEPLSRESRPPKGKARR